VFIYPASAAKHNKRMWMGSLQRCPRYPGCFREGNIGKDGRKEWEVGQRTGSGNGRGGEEKERGNCPSSFRTWLRP